MELYDWDSYFNELEKSGIEYDIVVAWEKVRNKLKIE